MSLNKITKNINSNKENYNILIDHYSEILYARIEKYSGFFTKEELKKLSYNYVKTKTLNYNFKENNTYLSSIMTLIKRLEKICIDQNYLINLYSIYVGINEKCEKYYYDKYSYLIDEFSKDKSLDIKNIKDDFNDIIKFVISICGSVIQDLSKKIRIYVHKNYVLDEYKRNFCKVNKKEDLFYIKDFIYKKFEKLVSDNCKGKLRKVIEEKFEEYYNLYYDGRKSCMDIKKYLHTRITYYLNEKLDEISFIYDEDKRKFNEETYRYLIYRYYMKLENINNGINYKDELENVYNNACNNYYEKYRKTSFEEYIKVDLRKYVKEQKTKYVDSEEVKRKKHS